VSRYRRLDRGVAHLATGLQGVQETGAVRTLTMSNRCHCMLNLVQGMVPCHSAEGGSVLSAGALVPTGLALGIAIWIRSVSVSEWLVVQL
jgi:hypothetical protein